MRDSLNHLFCRRVPPREKKELCPMFKRKPKRFDYVNFRSFRLWQSSMRRVRLSRPELSAHLRFPSLKWAVLFFFLLSFIKRKSRRIKAFLSPFRRINKQRRQKKEKKKTKDEPRWRLALFIECGTHSCLHPKWVYLARGPSGGLRQIPMLRGI